MSGPSLPLDPTIIGADRCGCCDGIGIEAPRQIWNRTGLPAIQYRIGDHGAFKDTLLARLTASDYPALGRLTTRDESDPTIALIDATAVLCDVLTFYQERIANESYLRTATQWGSLAGMARLIGYEPSPGLAATAYVAFTLETGTAAPDVATIPAGTRLQSIPAAGQLPQTFETANSFAARPEWNAMPVLRTAPQGLPGAATQSVLLQGTITQIRVGDRFLLIGGTDDDHPTLAPVAATAMAVTVDTTAGTTRIDLVSDAAAPSATPVIVPPPSPGSVLPRVGLTTDALESAILAQAWDGADLRAFIQNMKWSLGEVMAGVMAAAVATAPARLIRFRQRAAVFGHNAPAWNTLPAALRLPPAAGSAAPAPAPPYSDNWDDPQNATLNIGWSGNALVPPPAQSLQFGQNTTVPLDHVYSGLTPGGWVLLQDAGSELATRIVANGVGDTSLVAFTQSAKVTQIELDVVPRNPDPQDPAPGVYLSDFTRRGTTLFCDYEAWPFAPVPIPEPVEGTALLLDRIYLGLQVGQYVAVSGTRLDLTGVAATELAQIASVTVWGNVTMLTLMQPLAFSYDRASVAINANVVLASHGASVSETMGSGDAATPFQAFVLRQPPLTYIVDLAGAGPVSTLAVRVNGELWSEVPMLYGQAPTDRVYMTWRAEDGRTHVLFGDGTTGARLPTGTANVTAAYRTGVGAAGMVDAGAISLLMTRPLGVRSAANPLPSSGGVDPDPPDALRRAAPERVVALDRIVSLADYASYALTYPGIGKALASWRVSPRGRSVVLTVAGEAGVAVGPGSPLGRSLLAAIRARSEVGVAVQLADYTPVFFQVGANLAIDPSYVADDVRAAVAAALQASFTLDARDFGQDVQASEVITAIQGVSGVIACDLTLFCRPPAQAGVADVLVAAVPAPGTGRPAPAEILMVDPRPLQFGTLS